MEDVSSLVEGTVAVLTGVGANPTRKFNFIRNVKLFRHPNYKLSFFWQWMLDNSIDRDKCIIKRELGFIFD